MDIKRISKIIFIVLIIICNIVLAILLMKYINLYNKEEKPKFGYYLDKDSQITSIDLYNHNIIYESFYIGEYNYDDAVQLINFIRENNYINWDNKYLYVKVLFNEYEYDIGVDDDYNKLHNELNENKGKYFFNIIYNEDTGFVNTVSIKKNLKVNGAIL